MRKIKRKIIRRIKRISGWSIGGRPFSPAEFKRSHLKLQTKVSYSMYLKNFSRLYKNVKMRKTL